MDTTSTGSPASAHDRPWLNTSLSRMSGQVYVGASSRDIRLTGTLHIHDAEKE